MGLPFPVGLVVAGLVTVPIGLLIGLPHDTFTHVPVELLNRHKKRLDLSSPAWLGVLAATGQKFAHYAPDQLPQAE